MRFISGLSLVLSIGLAGDSQQPRFATSVDMVRFEVNVTNDRGPVFGLRAGDFEVIDNGQRQPAEIEELADAPLDIAMAVQPLESIAQIAPEQIPRLSAALQAFLQGVESRDRLAITLAGAPPSRIRAMDFGRPMLESKWWEEGMDAAPFDALLVALSDVAVGTPGRRRTVVVFTNAADFRSTTRFEHLTAIARRLGPAFVLVGAPVNIREEVNVQAATTAGQALGDRVVASVSGSIFPASLQILAKRTGGLTVNLGRGEPSKLMAETFRWLRTRYEVSYRLPPGRGWHTVGVKVKRRGVSVTVREGYWVN